MMGGDAEGPAVAAGGTVAWNLVVVGSTTGSLEPAGRADGPEGS